VSPVKYELGFISQRTVLFKVTADKTSNLLTSIGRNELPSPLKSDYRCFFLVSYSTLIS
jgi:hypothetical protein